MRKYLGPVLLLVLVAQGAGCGAEPCTGWTYGGCCGLGNKAQFIRKCLNPDGTERVETRCTGTCGP